MNNYVCVSRLPGFVGKPKVVCPYCKKCFDGTFALVYCPKCHKRIKGFVVRDKDGVVVDF